MLPPLMLVIFVSMVKDAFEDHKRYLNDKKENETIVSKFTHGKGYEATQW
jgi:hypothetical protein